MTDRDPLLDHLAALNEAQLARHRAHLPPSTPDAERLVELLGGLPLSLHVLTGWLNAGHTPAELIARMGALGFEPGRLAPDEASSTRERALSATLDLAMEALADQLGGASCPAFQGLLALGVAPPGDLGHALALALIGAEDGDALVAACELSLIDPTPAEHRADRAWSLHPLIARALRRRLDDGAHQAARSRLHGWFMARLPEGEGQGERWDALVRERSALAGWLASLVGEEACEAALVGIGFGVAHGPYEAWLAVHDRAWVAASAEQHRLQLLWRRGQLANRVGDLDEAHRCATAMHAFAQALDEPRDAALAQALLADLLTRRGAPDEALTLLRGEVLPAFERLGDARERALTLGQIADLLAMQGELEQALALRQREQLPVYERLGDVRERAVVMGKIADLLAMQGRPDEALAIHQREELPVYERLGDVRAHAVALGKIASILMRRGELEEALAIHQHEQLPIFEHLGDVRGRAMTLGQIADLLARRGELDRALALRRGEQLPIYERLGDVRGRAVALGRIADLLSATGAPDEALALLRDEVLPAFERLGDVRSLLVGRTHLALNLLRRNAPNDHHEARSLLRQARAEALRLRLPEAEQIAAIQRRAGWDEDAQED